MGTPASKPAPKPDRIDLRLFNVIIIHDVYVVSRTQENARKTILDAIQAGTTTYTEAVSREVTMPNSIRASWAEQSPFVADDVTDDEFETLKGITTSMAFERFYCKR